MKKLILALFIAISGSVTLVAQQTWPTMSKEQAERKAIMLGIARIRERFTAALGSGTRGSSGLQGAIVEYLQNIGTPVSYQIYQEMRNSGELR